MSSAENAPAKLELNLRGWAEGAIKAKEREQVLAEDAAEITLQLLRARDTALDDYKLDDDLPDLYQGIRGEVDRAHQEFRNDQQQLPDLVETVMQYLKTEVDRHLKPVEG